MFYPCVDPPQINVVDVVRSPTSVEFSSDANGNFSIEGIPAGTYEVVCWQEKFGKRTLTAEVTIGEGDTTKDFVFTRPKKK